MCTSDYMVPLSPYSSFSKPFCLDNFQMLPPCYEHDKCFNHFWLDNGSWKCLSRSSSLVSTFVKLFLCHCSPQTFFATSTLKKTTNASILCMEKAISICIACSLFYCIFCWVFQCSVDAILQQSKWIYITLLWVIVLPYWL